MQHPDDAVATEIRRVRHRRTPVTVPPDQNVLVNEARIAGHQVAYPVDVVAPYCVGELHGLNESHPTGRLVAAREHQLRVRELRACGIDITGMAFLHLRDRGFIAGMNRTEKIFGLMLELIETGAYGRSPRI